MINENNNNNFIITKHHIDNVNELCCKYGIGNVTIKKYIKNNFGKNDLDTLTLSEYQDLLKFYIEPIINLTIDLNN